MHNLSAPLCLIFPIPALSPLYSCHSLTDTVVVSNPGLLPSFPPFLILRFPAFSLLYIVCHSLTDAVVSTLASWPRPAARRLLEHCHAFLSPGGSLDLPARDARAAMQVRTSVTSRCSSTPTRACLRYPADYLHSSVLHSPRSALRTLLAHITPAPTRF